MSEKLDNQVVKMVRQHADLKAYFTSLGATSDEIAALGDVQKKLVALRQKTGGVQRPAQAFDDTTAISGAEPQAGPLDGGGTLAGPDDKKAPGAPAETPGYKEASWVRASSSVSSTAVHVGSIFFATKDSTLGGSEEGLLQQLAKSYSPYARRNLHIPGGQLGLKGKVIGYADPRPSVEPDNNKLSAARGTIVARRLTQLLSGESGLVASNFEISSTAAGAPTGTKVDAREFARLRRADIFLEGGAMAPPPAVKPPDPPSAPAPIDPSLIRDVMSMGEDDACFGQPNRAHLFEKVPKLKSAYQKGWETALKSKGQRRTTMKGTSEDERKSIEEYTKRKELRKKNREFLRKTWKIIVPPE